MNASINRRRLVQTTALTTAAAIAPAKSSVFAAPNVISRRLAQGERMPLSIAVWASGPVDDDNLFKQTIEDRFNVELDLWVFDRASMKEQVNPRIASGEFPDLLAMSDFMSYPDYVNQGVLREVSLDAFKQHMPKFVASTQAFEPLVWYSVRSEDKYYGVPKMSPSQLSPFTDGWRLDWLEKVGYSELPQTIDEFGEAYAKFVSDDPDGNGSGDTYGLGNRGKDAPHWGFATFFGSYGTVPHMWVRSADGGVEWGGTNEGARQAIELLAGWYKDGLIDPEFLTNDGAALTQDWANGQIGYITPSQWYRLIPGTEFYDAVTTLNPDAKVAMADAPKGPDGKFGYFNWGPLTGGQYFFGRELGDDRLPDALDMLETMFTDPELATTLKFGLEGEHWERDADNGSIVPLAPYDDPEQRGPLGTNIYFEPVPEVWETWQRSDLAELTSKATAGNLEFVPYAELNVPGDVYEGLDLRTIQSTWYLDLISGRESLDRWDDFVAEYTDQGGEKLSSATQESIAAIDTAKEEIVAALE